MMSAVNKVELGRIIFRRTNGVGLFGYAIKHDYVYLQDVLPDITGVMLGYHVSIINTS